MPVGVPRSGKTTLRIPRWLHEELAAEAFERNVSINQLCFEALIARRALRDRPPMKRAMARVDATRRVNREKRAQAVEQAVAQVAKENTAAVKLSEQEQRVVDAVRELGRGNPDEVVAKLGTRDSLAVHAALLRLSMTGHLVRVAAQTFRLNALLARASPRSP